MSITNDIVEVPGLRSRKYPNGRRLDLSSTNLAVEGFVIV